MRAERKARAAASGPMGLLGAAVGGYLLGTTPSADVAAGLAPGGSADLRREGTGNPGALNATHVLGRRWGAAVSVVDMGKGVLAAMLGRRLAGERGANAAATAAVVGHCLPVWSGFRGGKGVATSVGQVIATFPAYLPVDFGVAAATAAIPSFARRTEMATSVASLAWIGCALTWWRRRWPTGTGAPATVALPIGAVVSSIVIQVRFRSETAGVDAFNRDRASEADHPPDRDRSPRGRRESSPR